MEEKKSGFFDTVMKSVEKTMQKPIPYENDLIDEAGVVYPDKDATEEEIKEYLKS